MCLNQRPVQESLSVFLIVRLAGGYDHAYEYSSVLSPEFWLFSKYPPDLAFLSWSFACVFASLALLRVVTRDGVPWWCMVGYRSSVYIVHLTYWVLQRQHYARAMHC